MEFDELDFYCQGNSGVACEIQVWNRQKIDLVELPFLTAMLVGVVLQSIYRTRAIITRT